MIEEPRELLIEEPLPTEADTPLPFPFNQQTYCRYEPIEKQIEEVRVLIVDSLLRDEDDLSEVARTEWGSATAAEIKREAQRAIKSATGPRQTSASEMETPGIRIVREGQLVTKDKPVAEEEELEQYVAGPGREIVVGDKVRLRSFGSVGIVDSIKDGEAEVRVKALRFREKLENLELVEIAPAPPHQKGKLERLRQSTGTVVHLASNEVTNKSELNVIGQTTDDAVDAVDKFLDEASLASMSQVRIVHGHGTGALRRAIGELLRGHPHVARFVAAPPDQGGAGATLVELRQ